jgi:hypothetical protein
MKTFGVTLLCPFMLLTFAAAVPAGATAIDFETQAANTGGNLTGIPNSPLTIAAVTFTGGELLNGEIGLNADPSGVYASEGLFGSGETNPLVISFAAPVEGFSVLVLNGDDVRSYTVSDNIGDSATNSLASAGGLGAATFSLPGSGLTTVTITSANADGWDFAIDNVTFSAATTSTPEPESMLLAGAGLLLLSAIRGKQLRALVHYFFTFNTAQ